MGSFNRADAITYAYRALRDFGDDADSQLVTDTEVGVYVDQAAKAYTLRRPRHIVTDLTADGTTTTALPGGWIEEFSRVVAVESPPGKEPPAFADPRWYAIYQGPTGWSLRWSPGHAPSVGTTVRLTYTGARSFAVLAADTTVLDIDFEAVCALAVSLAAEAITAKYGQTQEPILNSDIASSRTTKVQDWQGIARRWRDIYERHMAAIKAPASGRVNWDGRMTSGGDFVTHPRRGR